MIKPPFDPGNSNNKIVSCSSVMAMNSLPVMVVIEVDQKEKGISNLIFHILKNHFTKSVENTKIQFSSLLMSLSHKITHTSSGPFILFLNWTIAETRIYSQIQLLLLHKFRLSFHVYLANLSLIICWSALLWRIPPRESLKKISYDMGFYANLLANNKNPQFIWLLVC